MDKSYVLGRNKTVFETAEFPQIASDGKVGVLFQGNIESTLVAAIAKELYGIDRVVFMLVTSEKILSYKDDEDKLNILKKTFQDGMERIGGIHKLELDSDAFNEHQSMNATVKKILLDRYQGKLKFVLSGHSKLHEDSMDFLKNCGWDQGNITKEKLKSRLEQDKKKYPDLYEHVCENNNRFFGVSKNIGFEQIEEDFYTNVRPFRKLLKHEIIDLYEEAGFLSHLYKTSSCDVDVGNCGICSGCTNRKLSYKKSLVTDLTKYTFN